jgi:predicted kinase
MKQFILIVNGPICGGKSFLIDSIMDNYKKVFRLSANKIKFLISDYTPERDRVAVQECLLILAEKMLQNGMSLVLEGGSVAQGTLNESLYRLAEKYHMNVVTVNVEAPLEVLKNRFEERLATAATRGSKLSVTTDDGYMERYNAYLAIKKDSQKTFDSSTQSPEEMMKEILEMM